MWWMNAFDKSLKGLDTAEEGKVVQTLTNGGLDMVAKGGSKFVGNGGLYASFVRGESLSGTITPEYVERPLVSDKRKRGEDGRKAKEERRARKAAKRAARARSLLAAEPAAPIPINEPAQTSEQEEDVVAEGAETKERRRERRNQKKLTRQAKEDGIEGVIPTSKRKKRRKT